MNSSVSTNSSSIRAALYPNRVTISPSCASPGAIAHLILHSLGVGHEFNRPDREGWIYVNGDALDNSQTSGGSLFDWFTSSTESDGFIAVASPEYTNATSSYSYDLSYQAALAGLDYGLFKSILLGRWTETGTAWEGKRGPFDLGSLSGASACTFAGERKGGECVNPVFSVGDKFESAAMGLEVMGNREFLTARDVWTLKGMYNISEETAGNSSMEAGAKSETRKPLPYLTGWSLNSTAFIPVPIPTGGLIGGVRGSGNTSAPSRPGAGSQGLECFLSLTSADEIASVAAASPMMSSGIGGALAKTTLKKKIIIGIVTGFLGLFIAGLLLISRPGRAMIKTIGSRVIVDEEDGTDSEEDGATDEQPAASVEQPSAPVEQPAAPVEQPVTPVEQPVAGSFGAATVSEQ